MKKLLLILFIPFIVNAQQVSVMDAVVLKEGSDADNFDLSGASITISITFRTT